MVFFHHNREVIMIEKNKIKEIKLPKKSIEILKLLKIKEILIKLKNHLQDKINNLLNRLKNHILRMK